MKPFTNESYFEQSFSSVALLEEKISGREFESCIFQGCDFTGCEFQTCSFLDCEFKQCNFSAAKFPFSNFDGARFTQCKVIGIDWTRIEHSLISSSAPITFIDCNVSQSSFYGLTWPKFVLKQCQSHQADFRSGNFQNANFQNTDFSESMFDECQLQNCNFVGAIHYQIDLNRNQISGARFSTIEALSLLTSLNIVLED